MMGVIKLLSPEGRLVDQTLYLGGMEPVVFGRAEKPCVVSRAVYLDSTGRSIVIWNARDLYLAPLDVPKLTLEYGTIEPVGFLPAPERWLDRLWKRLQN